MVRYRHAASNSKKGVNMAIGRPGADSTSRVDHKINGVNIVDSSTALFGEAPLFWGRYFKNPQELSAYEYTSRIESPILAARNIRVLPIAQQTPFVGGTSERGSQDAKGNIGDLIASFDADNLVRQGDEFLMFLDVEPSHPLSQSYYIGWAQTLISESITRSSNRFKVLPAVYLNRNDAQTWRALMTAVNDSGVACGGVWVANYGSRPGCTALIDWQDDEVHPGNIAPPFKVLIWQYAEECHGGSGFDCNETNPNIDLFGDLLNKLILPS